MLCGPGTSHFEDLEIYHNNVNEMNRIKCPFYKVPTSYEPTSQFIDKLHRYKKKRTNGVYGFKEPRILALLSAYKEVWDSQTLWICCTRNPKDAAESGVRNKYWSSIQEGVAIYKDLLKAMAEHKWHIFDYDEDLKTQSEALSETLAIRIELTKFWKDNQLKARF